MLNAEQKCSPEAGLQILVVEDNYDDMEYVCGMLKELDPGATVYKAGKAAKSLEILCNNPVNLVLLDVELPDMNGFSLANRIRNMEEYGLLPLVFITGTDANPLAAHKRYHCYDYIRKPFTAKTFRQILEPLIKSLIRQRQTGEAKAGEREKVILLETKEEVFVVKYRELLFAEISGRTITVHMRDRKISGIRMKLEDFVQHVNSPDFQRCHKSYAVNVSAIGRLEKIDYRSWSISFQDDRREQQDKCMVSKTWRDAVLQALESREVTL